MTTISTAIKNPGVSGRNWTERRDAKHNHFNPFHSAERIRVRKGWNKKTRMQEKAES